ncbi:hypothetical protein [Rubrivivax gelatinosus]|uniref:hypothetical protein n=1 Tax=Rubrivivax gelatinosus TaxID=28068 RepID=UPI00190482FB|nr:hypothetical protein [Rubrivivax gelatinosus]
MKEKLFLSATKSAQHRLTKVAVKRARVASADRARFLLEVKTTRPTEESQREAQRLVERVRAAKTATFLQQYRVSA